MNSQAYTSSPDLPLVSYKSKCYITEEFVDLSNPKYLKLTYLSLHQFTVLHEMVPLSIQKSPSTQ